jgi:tRNA (guanosine-2'-O-)-methyltransferase
VSIYEAMRQKKNAGHYNKQRLDDGTFTTLLAEWGFRADDLDAIKQEEQ